MFQNIIVCFLIFIVSTLLALPLGNYMNKI